MAATKKAKNRRRKIRVARAKLSSWNKKKRKIRGGNKRRAVRLEKQAAEAKVGTPKASAPEASAPETKPEAVETPAPEAESGESGE